MCAGATAVTAHPLWAYGRGRKKRELFERKDRCAMSKSSERKRARELQRLAERYPRTVVADKAALRMILFGFIAAMDEGSEDYVRFCDVAMALVGAQRPEGGMSEQFATSPYWTGAGTPADPLRASEHAKLAMEVMGVRHGR